MISHSVYNYCKDDIRKIENFDKAITDRTVIWHCHHRLELTLDNKFANSAKSLIRMEMYYNRPYYELIFLPPVEHIALHSRSKTRKIRKVKRPRKYSLLNIFRENKDKFESFQSYEEVQNFMGVLCDGIESDIKQFKTYYSKYIINKHLRP